MAGVNKVRIQDLTPIINEYLNSTMEIEDFKIICIKLLEKSWKIKIMLREKSSCVHVKAYLSIDAVSREVEKFRKRSEMGWSDYIRQYLRRLKAQETH